MFRSSLIITVQRRLKNTRNIVEFTLIYNRYKTKLYNYILKMVSNKMISEDITQDVFLKLFNNLNNIKNKNSVNYWLFKTARNEIFSYYRSKKIKVDQFNVLDSDDIEISAAENLFENIELKEMREIIMNEITELPMEQREVFILKEYGELSYKEIAALLDIEENLVKSRLYKTRQKLIDRISKKYKSN